MKFTFQLLLQTPSHNLSLSWLYQNAKIPHFFTFPLSFLPSIASCLTLPCCLQLSALSSGVKTHARSRVSNSTSRMHRQEITSWSYRTRGQVEVGLNAVERHGNTFYSIAIGIIDRHVSIALFTRHFLT